MNEIHVQFFAHLAEAFGSSRIFSLRQDAGTTDLFEALRAIKPETSRLLSVCRIATDERILADGETLPSSVCIFPPMSGG